MDGSLCIDDVLVQFRAYLAEAECGLEEVQAARRVLAARHLERTITKMKMRIAAVEVPDGPTNESPSKTKIKGMKCCRAISSTSL